MKRTKDLDLNFIECLHCTWAILKSEGLTCSTCGDQPLCEYCIKECHEEGLQGNEPDDACDDGTTA